MDSAETCNWGLNFSRRLQSSPMRTPLLVLLFWSLGLGFQIGTRGRPYVSV